MLPPAVSTDGSAGQIVTSSDGGGSGGGQAAGAGAAAPSATLSHVTLANGAVVTFAPGQAITLSDAHGDVVLDAPSQVASTIQANGGVVTLHPRAAEPATLPTLQAQLSGQVTPAGPGYVVQFLAPGRTDFQGGRADATGRFSFPVTVGNTTAGLLLARDGAAVPRLGLTRVTVAPTTATTATVALQAPAPQSPAPASLQLLDFAPDSHVLPDLPPTMSYTASSLQVIEGQGTATAWAATLLASSALLIPSYSLPGFVQEVLLQAATPDNTQQTTTLGPVGNWPQPLAPPQLQQVAAPRPGTAITWPAVPRATVYVARLYQPDIPDPPLWEGASTDSNLLVPASVTGLSAGCVLQVDAWDAPEVSVYGVASLSGPRDLRLPVQPLGLTGSHSWATRTFAASP